MSDDIRVRAPHLADAADIIRWSERNEATTEFPRLIRRLIQQNNDQVVRNEIRSGEGTRLSGFDGTVVAIRSTWFVPDGKSFWEMGTGGTPQDKANSDYRKRTDDLDDGVQSEEIFVFITSRRWDGKQTWEAKKRAEGRWRDVRAFDVDDIEQALEEAPAIHIWFSEMVGKPARGIQSIEDWWDKFSSKSNPALTPQLVLVGREDTASELGRLFQQDRRVTVVGSKSVDDDLAFIASTILSMDEQSQDRFLSRALFVRNAHALRWLDSATDLMLLVPMDGPLRREAESVRHHVVLLADEDTAADIAIPAIDEAAFAHRLVEDGLADEEARKLARGAHRSLRRYQRLAARPGSALPPEWSEQLRSPIVRRAWLAGGWQGGKSGDVDVLTKVLGQGYERAANELWHALRDPDPMFTHIGGTWKVTTPEESWDYCRSYVTPEDLNAIEAAVQTVLGATDPALELPVADRWMAGIYGKSRIHSSSLRQGLATTLAIFGAFGERIILSEGATGRSWAESVVFSLLKRANDDRTGQLWASLSDVMPLIAEAAPAVFLREVQSATEGTDPLLKTQFIDQGDPMFVSSPHTGLLWALEGLAWSGEYFANACNALACLAAVDPGGRLSNRPLASMTSFFRVWYPQTSATVERRMDVLQSLVRRHSAVGWTLLLSLIPEHQDYASPIHEPRFRTWKPADRETTRSDYWTVLESISLLILEVVQREPARWIELAPHWARLAPRQRTLAHAQLEQLAQADLSPEVGISIWKELSKVARSHRSYPDAHWSLPAAEIDRLEAAISGLGPVDPCNRHSWLFDDQFPSVGITRHGRNDNYTRELALQRKSAVREILQESGLPALINLAARVSQSWNLGTALGSINLEAQVEVIDLLDSEEPQLINFAFSYLVEASAGKLDWLQPYAEFLEGRPLAQARLLLVANDLPRTWEYLGNLSPGVIREYWERFGIHGHGVEFPLANQVARHLIVHGRPAVALDLLSMYCENENSAIEPRTVLEGFEALLGAVDPESRVLSNWEIERLLDFLRRSEVDEDGLALLEWRLLPALGIEGRSPVLERRLARDPHFFVEILSLAFGAKSQPIEIEEPDIPARVSGNAFRLLLDWKQIPGSDSLGGEVSESKLRAWVSDARFALVEADRLSMGDEHIGRVFAHSRTDADGTWPTRAVREIIEEVGSTRLEEGLHVGVVNNRGITSRSPDEGGDQERTLASNLDGQARLIQDQYPRTAAVLRALADGYRSEARTHDVDAERFREGLDR